MTDTPIIDAAALEISRSFHEEGYNPEIDEPSVWQEFRKAATASLRAALPWDPTTAAIEAIARVIADVAKNHAALFRSEAIAAYRAQPSMRELWPEKFQ